MKKNTSKKVVLYDRVSIYKIAAFEQTICTLDEGANVLVIGNEGVFSKIKFTLNGNSLTGFIHHLNLGNNE